MSRRTPAKQIYEANLTVSMKRTKHETLEFGMLAAPDM